MKAFLMYAGRDFDLGQELPPNEQDLTQDLGLNILFEAMANGDRFLFDVAKRAVLCSLDDPTAITYRQRILQDCQEEEALVRQMYEIAVETIAGEKKVYGGFLGFRTPDSILHRSVELLQFLVGRLKALKSVGDENATRFRSAGFTAFFEMLSRELDDEYFASVEAHLHQLKFRHGVLISAELGEGNKGTDYVLRAPGNTKRSWIEKISGNNRNSYTLRIADRDEAGANALAELRGRGINLVANALAQSTDHVLSFFDLLRCELGFYVGCLNLQERLAEKGEPVCFPVPVSPNETALTCQGLYDACLSLSMTGRVVGNDIEADGKSLVMITGANQGGKSTLLRSVGLAHLMMQCGMFVPAEAFRANTCSALFTHYKREEDAAMESGKLDEELSRMSQIADWVAPNGIVLFNESFASTNEREGSEVARQIVRALLDTGVKVLFVTHFFDLAHGFYCRQMAGAHFLRAERRPDGHRTFKLIEGEPLPTSYGEDLYHQVFDRPTADQATLPDPLAMRG